MLKFKALYFHLMSKDFWIVTTIVTNPAFSDLVKAFQPWIESIGGSVFAKHLDDETLEGNRGKLSLIIEFPSKKAAIDTYNSPEYQELSK